MTVDPNYAAAKTARQDLKIGNDAPVKPFSPNPPPQGAPQQVPSMIGAANASSNAKPTKAVGHHPPPPKAKKKK